MAMNNEVIHRHFHCIFIVIHRNKFISSQLHENSNKINSFQTYKQKNEYEKITMLQTSKCL